ncbi:MAG: hypothetical protein RBQ91_05985 [Acholeplasma sp.]|nr:hypothetical protein [Acholeplasma sp.]
MKKSLSSRTIKHVEKIKEKEVSKAIYAIFSDTSINDETTIQKMKILLVNYKFKYYYVNDTLVFEII